MEEHGQQISLAQEQIGDSLELPNGIGDAAFHGSEIELRGHRGHGLAFLMGDRS